MVMAIRENGFQKIGSGKVSPNRRSSTVNNVYLSYYDLNIHALNYYYQSEKIWWLILHSSPSIPTSSVMNDLCQNVSEWTPKLSVGMGHKNLNHIFVLNETFSIGYSMWNLWLKYNVGLGTFFRQTFFLTNLSSDRQNFWKLFFRMHCSIFSNR